MMSVTHCAISVAAVSLAVGTANPWVLICGAIASQLPDLDTTKSLAGQTLYPIAHWIESRHPHRTITHSFFSTGFTAAIAAPLWIYLGWEFWAAVVIGQFVGWFADCFTKSGAAAFWPNKIRLVIPGNPRARLDTKSAAEYWILAIALFSLVVTVQLISAGGITEQFERSFFSSSGTAAGQFKKYGANQIVKISVKGINVRTSQSVNQNFTVIEAPSDQDVIAESEDGKLYKIGQAPDVQIRANSVKSSLGGVISIQSQEQTLSEIAIEDWLKQVDKNAYLSGVLLAEDGSEFKQALTLEEFPTVQISATQITLFNARPWQLSAIGEIWIANGRVIQKVRNAGNSNSTENVSSRNGTDNPRYCGTRYLTATEQQSNHYHG